MKRIILSLAVAFVTIGAAQAQDQKCCNTEKKECCKAQKKEKTTVVKIEDHNIFSQCFKDIDTNGDGIVDCCEAQKATYLSLERGGRSKVVALPSCPVSFRRHRRPPPFFYVLSLCWHRVCLARNSLSTIVLPLGSFHIGKPR